MNRIAAVFLLATATTHAAAREMQSFCKAYEPLERLTGLRYVTASVNVEMKDPSVGPGQMAFTIQAKSGPLRVPVASDGTFTFPITPELCRENPQVTATHSDEAFVVRVRINVGAPPVRRFDYRLLTDMRSDWDEAVRRQNLVYRVLAPGAKAGMVRFEKGKAAAALVRLPHGTERIAADADGELRIPFNEEWRRVNPAIELTEMPVQVTLAFKDKG